MNVPLTPDLEALIQKMVVFGMHKNAAEVVREGLRLLAQADEWKTEVQSKIAEGMLQARAGQLVDGDEAAQRLMRRVDSHRKKPR